MENINKLWLETYRKIDELRRERRKLNARYDCVAAVEASKKFDAFAEEVQDKIVEYLDKLHTRINAIGDAIDALIELIEKLDDAEASLNYIKELEGAK